MEQIWNIEARHCLGCIDLSYKIENNLKNLLWYKFYLKYFLIFLQVKNLLTKPSSVEHSVYIIVVNTKFENLHSILRVNEIFIRESSKDYIILESSV